MSLNYYIKKLDIHISLNVLNVIKLLYKKTGYRQIIWSFVFKYITPVDHIFINKNADNNKYRVDTILIFYICNKI